MIKNKQDLRCYLEEDRKMLGWSFDRPRLFRDEAWRFQIALRNMEFCENTNAFILKKLFWRYRHHKLGIKLGFDIPINVFDSGLCIRHYGSVIVNPKAIVGKNCIIQQCVCIGQDGKGGDNVPRIGNDVYIGTGAIIIGKIEIADGVCIGANSVVNKDITEKNAIVAGSPAQIIGKR